jgi:hypothetical protein
MSPGQRRRQKRQRFVTPSSVSCNVLWPDLVFRFYQSVSVCVSAAKHFWIPPHLHYSASKKATFNCLGAAITICITCLAVSTALNLANRLGICRFRLFHGINYDLLQHNRLNDLCNSFMFSWRQKLNFLVLPRYDSPYKESLVLLLLQRVKGRPLNALRSQTLHGIYQNSYPET